MDLMSEKSFEFYRKPDHFHKVIALHEASDLEWDSFSELVPACPRGWFELSQLQAADRIEFTQAFWLAKLPFETDQAHELEKKVHEFFAEVDEIGIFATQATEGAFFEVHMVYCLRGDRAFFHGSPPANPESIVTLSKQFSHVNFPSDYLAFLEIHDGFNKYIDAGVIKTRDMARVYHQFQEFLSKKLDDTQMMVHPPSIIPFYECAELNCCQCFYADWYTGEEIGNLFFSEKVIDQNDLGQGVTFPTFSKWLVSYLEEA